MTSSRAEEVLYDSEAALRLVDAEVARLRQQDGLSESAAPVKAAVQGLEAFDSKPAIVLLPAILNKATEEIRMLLTALRSSRNALESATVGRLATTHDKLKQVTNATEVAATDILDGLDRAQVLVDKLDASEGDADVSRDLRNQLRDELFTATTHLQFQDITTQQLNHAAKVLVEMEERLAEVARVIDPTAQGFAPEPTRVAPDVATFDPNATIKNADERQAVADSVFKRTGTNG
jgi:chemotaxis regulatin CheY-phosphate phosphatase CheZ